MYNIFCGVRFGLLVWVNNPFPDTNPTDNNIEYILFTHIPTVLHMKELFKWYNISYENRIKLKIILKNCILKPLKYFNGKSHNSNTSLPVSHNNGFISFQRMSVVKH